MSGTRNGPRTGKPCDICGDIGVEDVIAICSQCKIACEHVYCMQKYEMDIPSVWLCEECELNNQTALFGSGVKESLSKSSMLNSSGCVISDKVPNDLRRYCINREKKVETGKVKYLPAQEVIKLSSGTKKSETPSKPSFRNSGSSSGPSIISPQTPIQSNFLKPLEITKSNPTCLPSGDINPHRPGNVKINPMVQQRVVQLPKVQKGKVYIPASMKENVSQGRRVNGLKSTYKSASTTETVANKVLCTTSQLPRRSPRISGGNDSINVEQRKSDAGSANLMKNLPCDPALDASWVGSFKVLDNHKHKEFYDGIQAHPPARVRRKIYEFSKQMPKILDFEFIPRCNLQMRVLDDPDQNDIGLYFFPSDSRRSQCYISLLELMVKQDLVMRSHMDFVELLVLTSKLLDAGSQTWKGEYFLWGLFRTVDKASASQKCKEENSLLFCPSSNKCDNLMEGDDIQVVDMEIDMLGGQSVGRIDVAIPIQSPSSCAGGEFVAPYALHVWDAKSPVVSRNLNYNSTAFIRN